MARVVKVVKSAEVRFGPQPVAPAPIDPATLTDYSCQVTEARITAAANATNVPATFCEPATTINVPSSFTLELNGLQDWGAGTDSFSEYLFANDAEIVAFALYLDGALDPEATGLVSLAAGDFGGVAGEVLVMKGSFPILGYPEITDSAGAPIRTAASKRSGTLLGEPSPQPEPDVDDAEPVDVESVA
jgi:hypothetical protein